MLDKWYIIQEEFLWLIFSYGHTGRMYGVSLNSILLISLLLLEENLINENLNCS